MNDLVVSGIGVVTAIGQGKDALMANLLSGQQRFGVLQRPGRQRDSAFLGAELQTLDLPAARRPARAASLSGQAALCAIDEAWREARLEGVESERIGLIVGGSNFQQRESLLMHETYQHRSNFVRPTYALSFMDTDVCGLCTEQFGIRGLAYSVGGASASGQLAIAQGATALLCGQVDVCIVLGALMDVSYLELQAFRSIGAMGSDRYGDRPESACRPFDSRSDGFIFGESCGALILERGSSARARAAQPYASLAGWGIAIDAHRNPDASVEGETRAIRAALQASKWESSTIGYVNPHGTGSPGGDAAELQAIRGCQLDRALLNTTKSLLGHGLSAAGVVEVAVTLLQMRAGRFHPSLNLDDPVDASLNWVRSQAVTLSVERALTLSMGFGGINSAICWQNC